jgi:hypothetical protein
LPLSLNDLIKSFYLFLKQHLSWRGHEPENDVNIKGSSLNMQLRPTIVMLKEHNLWLPLSWRKNDIVDEHVFMTLPLHVPISLIIALDETVFSKHCRHNY